jgi:hypothetical protein
LKNNIDFCSKKNLESSLELLKLFLPELLVDHFELTSTKKDGETLHLHFEEINKPPVEHISHSYLKRI